MDAKSAFQLKHRAVIVRLPACRQPQEECACSLGLCRRTDLSMEMIVIRSQVVVTVFSHHQRMGH